MEKLKLITVWTDEAYHEKIKRELATALMACQRLLDTANRLDIEITTDIYELLISPEKCFNDAIDKLIPAPVKKGRFSVKREVQLSQLELPDKRELLKVAKETQKVLYCGVPGLFHTDGKTVSLDEGIANFYITMNDVTIKESETHKIDRAAKLNTWLELTNSLNIDLNQRLFNSASPVSNRFFFSIAMFEGGNQRGENCTLKFLPDFLREVLQ